MINILVCFGYIFEMLIVISRSGSRFATLQKKQEMRGKLFLEFEKKQQTCGSFFGLFFFRFVLFQIKTLKNVHAEESRWEEAKNTCPCKSFIRWRL